MIPFLVFLLISTCCLYKDFYLMKLTASRAMATILSPESTGAAAISAFLLLVSLFMLISRNGQNRTSAKRRVDQAPGTWPVIGHLHLLAGPEPAHRVLGNMADKYGPIFTIKIGVNQALVVSNWEIAKECFTVNDIAFASPGRTMASELLAYNYLSFAVSPYGSYWRQLRKIATVELLSNRGLQKHKHVRESETKASIKRMFQDCKNGSSSHNTVLVEMNHWFVSLLLDIILRTLAGTRQSSAPDDGLSYLNITEFFALYGKFVVSDALPFLRCLDIGGNEKLMKKAAKTFDKILQQWLDEHKMRRASGEVNGDEDFMYVMLSLLDDNPELVPDHDGDTVIKATCQTLFLAAADTTATTLTWAMALLVNDRGVLNKAREELNVHVGAERQVNESDLKNLVYLRAILEEAMRLYPAAPFLIPRESTAECTLSGYHIPAGTQLFVNVWKIHRDPRVWEEPLRFKPERFVTRQKDIDVKGGSFEYLPFGNGRRMCPGISLALRAMQLCLASLLHGFDFASPSGEPVDMGEAKSAVLAKATPLQLLVTPRLADVVYG